MNVFFVLYMIVMCVLLFCILAVFVYLYDLATTDCFNLAFMLQDLSKRIQARNDDDDKDDD